MAMNFSQPMMCEDEVISMSAMRTRGKPEKRASAISG
jgi:hypothetical protein